MLITGASSGIGKEFSFQLAKKGHNLILVARRESLLNQIATELEEAYKVRISVLSADLQTLEGINSTAKIIEEQAPIYVINNAGFGLYGPYAENDPQQQTNMVMLNALAVHTLTQAAARANLPHARGGIINVASTAAFQPMPYFATYAATKAFVLYLTEAIAEELKQHNIRVMALCPGPVATNFASIAGTENAYPSPYSMDATTCVSIALKCFDDGKIICIPGALNRLGAYATKVVPRAAVRKFLSLYGQQVYKRYT